MDIQFNGQPLAIAVGTTVTALLAAQGLAGGQDGQGFGHWGPLRSMARRVGEGGL